MDRSVRAGLILLGGVALLGAGLLGHAILLEPTAWTVALVAGGLLLSAWGAYTLRGDLDGLLRRRRGEIAAYTLGVVGVVVALTYLSARYPVRFDLTEARRFSLSPQTTTMLKRLEKPVHVVFF